MLDSPLSTESIFDKDFKFYLNPTMKGHFETPKA